MFPLINPYVKVLDMQNTKEIVDTARIGKKGLPMHYQAFGIQPPMKTVPVEDGEPVIEHTPLTLDEIRTLSLTSIDNQAEQERLAHITPGVGQSMTYARKVEEAKAFTSDPDGDYPMLSASVGIDGDSLEQVAQIVLNLDYQWSLIGSHIETVRLAAKRDVNEAKTVSEIESIVNNLNWSVE